MQTAWSQPTSLRDLLNTKHNCVCRHNCKDPKPTPSPKIVLFCSTKNTLLYRHNRMEPTYKPWNSLCDQPGVDTAHCSGGVARLKKWLDDTRYGMVCADLISFKSALRPAALL